MFSTIQAIDESVIIFVQEHIRNGILTPVMVFFSIIGDSGAVWLILSAAMIITKKYRRAGILLLASVAVSWVMNDLILKPLIGRARPFEVIEGLEVLISLPRSYSFPSGHACSSFAAAYALTRGVPKYGKWFYVPAALIAASRVYLGVHYLSDIMVGIAVGTVGSIVIYWICVKCKKRIV